MNLPRCGGGEWEVSDTPPCLREGEGCLHRGRGEPSRAWKSPWDEVEGFSARTCEFPRPIRTHRPQPLSQLMAGSAAARTRTNTVQGHSRVRKVEADGFLALIRESM